MQITHHFNLTQQSVMSFVATEMKNKSEALLEFLLYRGITKESTPYTERSWYS